MNAADYLKLPYTRRITPDEAGGYVATIQEFPGLIAEGETVDEAIANLESAAESWVEAALETGQTIPEPISFHGYSGKVALRMPRGLHKRSAEMASSEGCSLNQWIVSAVAHYLGGKEAMKAAVDCIFTNVRLSQTLSNTTFNLFSPYAQFLIQPITPNQQAASYAAISMNQPTLGAMPWPKPHNTSLTIGS